MKRFSLDFICGIGTVLLGAVLLVFYAALYFGSKNYPAWLPSLTLVYTVLGAIPILIRLIKMLLRKEWSADLLAAISILSAAGMGEYFAGAIIVVMASGGELLEQFAIEKASFLLSALANRVPTLAHRQSNHRLENIRLEEVCIGDVLVILPHEICPADGEVIEGHGTMDEAFLTGEPFLISKAPGSPVISGALNQDAAMTIRVVRVPKDSRYAKMVEVIHAAEKDQPRLRRLADRIAAFYTPAALTVALLAWWLGHDSQRFLAVLVVATPCPLILAIPIAILGSISLCARHAIIIKKPAVMEQLDQCEIAIFDKTGTLTYGKPEVSEIALMPGFKEDEVLAFAAALEQYSRHPLGQAVLQHAHSKRTALYEASEVYEMPGAGLKGKIQGRRIEIVSRKMAEEKIQDKNNLPFARGGLECAVVIDEKLAAFIFFRGQPHPDSRNFLEHLGPKHHLDRVLIVSGDKESEVQYLADQVGVKEIYASKNPEEKLEIVKRETLKGKTMFVGDGINDAPALLAATVGISVGRRSDITSEAADVVIMDHSLRKVDTLFHISHHVKTIALQSAVGGMLLSFIAMGFAVLGHLPPVMGALLQEVIDLLAIFNALRAAVSPRVLWDFESHSD